MNQSSKSKKSLSADSARLAAPYEDVDKRLLAIELAHSASLSGEPAQTPSAQERFHAQPRPKRLAAVHRRLTTDVDAASRQVVIATSERQGIEIAQQGLEHARCKLANLLALERAVRVAEFIMANNDGHSDLVGLPINGVVGREAGSRLLSHLVRFNGMLGTAVETQNKVDLESVIDRATPLQSIHLLTLGSVRVEASAMVSGERADDTSIVPDIIVLHLSQDPAIFSSVVGS